MIHSNKFRSYYSLYMMRDGNFIVYGDGKGGVGTRTTNFSSRKVDFITYRHDVGLRPSQIHCTASPMESLLSKYYKVGSYDSSTIGIDCGDGKGRVGPRTTHLTDHEADFCIDCGNFVSYNSKGYSSMIHSYK